MKKFFFLISFIVTLFAVTKGQGHSRCNRSVIMDTAVFGPVYAEGPADTVLAMRHTNGLYFEKPHSVVWFCIDIPYDTILTFDLVPQKATDDLDFLLFKDNTDKNCVMCREAKKDFCEEEQMQKIIPVRTNIARADASLKGMTGLSAAAKNKTEPPGKYPAYSKAIAVKKGERYYLAVDNYTEAQGPFTLILHLRFPKEQAPAPAPKPANTLPAQTPHNVPLSKGAFTINVLDSATHKPVKASIKITWQVPAGNPKTDVTGSQCSLSIKHGQKINITCVAKGYLLAQVAYEAQTDSDIGTDVLLIPIREHEKMIFKNMEFKGGLAEFLPSAQEPLNDLLEFMLDNPDVKIFIKGYVNDPYNFYTNEYDLDLSKRRAEAVYDYLVSNGIKTYRLMWRGFGSKDMVYPNPVTEEQMQANRRVEVEIVK